MAKTILTAARLRELSSYDAVAGILTANRRFGSVSQGARLGYLAPTGYRRVCIDGVLHMEHRLIWLHVTGDWPAGVIDHMNGDKADNRFANFRDVTPTVNRHNTRRAIGAVGLLGVRQHGGRFQAEIGANKKRIHLGTFDTPQEAHEAYVLAKRQLHEGCLI